MAAYGERFGLLLGHRTCDSWSDFWPKAPSSPIADGLNAATKYIATHILSGRSTLTSTLLEQGLAETGACGGGPESLHSRRAFEEGMKSKRYVIRKLG